MLTWAAVFLVIALVAALIGFGGIGEVALTIAGVLAAIAVVLFIIHAVRGGTTTRTV